MKYQVDSYTLEYIEEEDKYYIYFEDSAKKQCCIEIDKEIFDTYKISKKQFKKMKNDRSRFMHILPLTEELVGKKALNNADSAEDALIKNIEKEKLDSAMNKLTDTQYRRIELHIINNITIRDLAKLERVNKSKIENSLKLGYKKIKKIFQNMGGQN